jgi:hypothetical protein
VFWATRAGRDPASLTTCAAIQAQIDVLRAELEAQRAAIQARIDEIQQQIQEIRDLLTEIIGPGPPAPGLPAPGPVPAEGQYEEKRPERDDRECGDQHAALRLGPSVLDLSVATPGGSRADAVEHDAEQHRE